MTYSERLASIIAGQGRAPAYEVMGRMHDVVVTDVGIIDDFGGMIPMREYDPVEFALVEDDTSLSDMVLDVLEIGMHVSRSMNFQGTISRGPYLSVLPISILMDGEPFVTVCWKQSNNGSTWAASTMPLPYPVGHCGYGWIERGTVRIGKIMPGWMIERMVGTAAK